MQVLARINLWKSDSSIIVLEIARPGISIREEQPMTLPILSIVDIVSGDCCKCVNNAKDQPLHGEYEVGVICIPSALPPSANCLMSKIET
jgi:hypothetical protein